MLEKAYVFLCNYLYKKKEFWIKNVACFVALFFTLNYLWIQLGKTFESSPTTSFYTGKCYGREKGDGAKNWFWEKIHVAVGGAVDWEMLCHCMFCVNCLKPVKNYFG